jgi:hypothetical protein
VAKRGSYHTEFLADPENCEYFVPVRWLQTVPLESAVQEIGMFGNEHCLQANNAEVAIYRRSPQTSVPEL